MQTCVLDSFEIYVSKYWNLKLTSERARHKYCLISARDNLDRFRNYALSKHKIPSHCFCLLFSPRFRSFSVAKILRRARTLEGNKLLISRHSRCAFMLKHACLPTVVAAVGEKLFRSNCFSTLLAFVAFSLFISVRE
jgi:hypothetical protein